MSQTRHQAITITGDIDAVPSQGQKAPNQDPEPEFADSSGPLFFMYRKMADEEDNKMAERWQKDADGILIFTGLFSAAVAALLAVTVLDLKQNPQDTSAFYLEQIYQFQVLANSNVPRPSTPAQPPSFSAPKYTIWVNSLWFLSLAMSLTGAMLATLQQQWARRYLRMTQPPRSSPHERARMREFFSNGVDKLRFSWAVEAVPTLIHMSLFLFFIGLLIYLFNTDHTVFIAVAWWIAVSFAIYLLIAFMPIIRLDSPYRAPLSSPACRAAAGILCLAFGILGFLAFFKDAARTRLYYKSNYYRKWVSRGMKKITAKTVEQSSLEIDGRVLKWTFNALGEDHELDRFFQRVLGFCRSKVVNDPQRILHNLGEWELSLALVRFLERTWLSNLVSESEKKRRFVMCAKVVDAAGLHHAAWWIHNGTFEGDWYRVLRSVEMGHSLRWRGIRGDQEIGLFSQSIVSQTIADVQGNNGSWVALATDQLGGALPRYLQHGNDSVLLANLIHITRQIFDFSSGVHGEMATKTSDCILPSLPRFDVRSTHPDLQHEFCVLWNSIVSEVQTRKSAIGILIGIRHIYLDLHQGTDSAPTAFDPTTVNTDPRLSDPSSYPVCELSEYRSLVGSGATGGPAHSIAIPTIPSPGQNPTQTSTHPTAESSSGSVRNASARPNPVSTSSHPISLNANIPLEVSRDIVADGAIRDITDTPSLANPNIQSTLSGDAALQPNKGATLVSLAMAPSSLPSPPLMPAPSSALTGGPSIPPQPELASQTYIIEATTLRPEDRDPSESSALSPQG